MINKETLKMKLSHLVPTNTELFKADLEKIRKNLISNSPEYGSPLLVYCTINKSAVYYMTVVYYSLQVDRILDFTVTTAGNISTQHFLDNESKDKDFHSNLYYDDLVFITVSELEYTSQYLEALIVDLVETRANAGKTTVVVYDSMDTTRRLTRIFDYFEKNSYSKISTNAMSTVTNTQLKPKNKARPKKEFF